MTSLQRGIELFNSHRFWEAHEAWEEIWLEAKGNEKTFLQGLIQVAAAYHHISRGTNRGAIRLFAAGLSKLALTAVHFSEISVVEVVASAQQHRERLLNGERIGAAEYPKLRYN
jgi:hypothetical protein